MPTLADLLSTYTSNAELSNLLSSDKFGQYSVKNYGAKGDGATDDSAAILSALSAASSSTSKTIYFPTGVYVVDGVTLTSTHFSGYYCLGDNASFSGITQHIEQFGNTVGNLSDLLTSATSSIVGAVNELKSAGGGATLTTRGDLLSRDSTGSIRVATGTPLQYAVAGNTSDTTPYNFQDSPQKVVTAIGDMIKSTGANTITRLPGSTGAGMLSYQVSSSSPTWAAGTNLQYPAIDATTDKVEFIDSPQKVLTATGDILYASAANTIAKLAIGTTGQVLTVSTGLIPYWATASASTGEVNLEVITSTSGYSWSPPASGNYKITIIGGGGGGARYAASYIGGGGGAGGTAIEVLTLSSTETITITVGAGGAALGASTAPANGNAGATSSFGAYLSATGGAGGSQTTIGANLVAGGAGGSGSGGDINITGGKGGFGFNDGSGGEGYPGEGGCSILGGWNAYGSGSYAQSGSAGAGTNGVCLIEY